MKWDPANDVPGGYQAPSSPPRFGLDSRSEFLSCESELHPSSDPAQVVGHFAPIVVLVACDLIGWPIRHEHALRGAKEFHTSVDLRALL